MKRHTRLKKRLRYFLIDIATSGKYLRKRELGMSDYLIRYVLFNALILFGIIILVAFGSVNAARGLRTDALVNFIMALVGAAAFAVARTRLPQIVPSSILMAAYGLLCVTIIWIGEAGGANFTFIYMYPLITVMMLGMKPGVVLSAVLLVLVSVEVFVPGASRYAYRPDVASRIVTGYVLVFFVMLVVEITRKTKDRHIEDQNRRLAELKNAAETANRTKSSFLANMSHEIRTPMNAIVGMAELLLRGELNEESQGYARDIKQASANLLSIINDLLDFSKIEAGRLEIVRVNYYLSSLVNDTVNIIRLRIMEKAIRFYTNVDAAIPNELSGDEVRLRQILLNLLGNAVKYTERGFISVTIMRDGDGGNGPRSVRLRIIVSDSGCGIKPEDRDKLFSDFIQVDTKRNRGIEGTGLGLAITRRLCQAMGGDISVESEYGKGSMFTVTLPQEIVSCLPFAAVDNPAGKKVLVYEGRMVYAQSVIWSLENLGVPYSLAASFEEFTEALRREPWYFVFSGYGLYNRIKSVMDAPDFPFSGGARPPLALMVEWGTEAYIPGTRFVSLPVQALSIADVLNGTPDSRGYGGSASVFAGTRFVAPEARILVVDDIATNLKVAEGLIAPYRVRVETCLSGAEAVELVKRNAYDLVFMDHMMPEMDGVEAAGLIRAWEASELERTERADGGASPPAPVPIIALTANAVSGMREMFLSRGFSGFLAKPIDVSKLDEIMGTWIPKRKQHKAALKKTAENSPTGSPAGAPVGEPGRGPDMSIPGVDVQRGIAATGGTEAGYRQVLAVFAKDAEERLGALRDFCGELNRDDPGRQYSEPELAAFTTQVHALKSASASLGAAGLSAEAARLEAAGKTGALALIRQLLPAFTRRLEELAAGIRAALNEHAEQETRAAPGPELAPLFDALTDAIKTRKAGALDPVLEELERRTLDEKTRGIVERVSDHVLLAEFDQALECAAALKAPAGS
jgi:signal transduction histidine kinase/CheY-like chemotaxis protein